MTIAVVIPCLNEEQYIDKLLDDLLRQSHKPDEVFVVDCNSKDKTIEVAKTFAERLPLSVLQSSYQSAAAARNTGAQAAKSDYLLFLDADMRINPNFIKQLRNRALKKKVDFVSPRLASVGRHPFDHATTWILSLWNGMYHMIFRRRAAGVGGAMFIKRSVHEAIGEYNPKLREFDDIDYMHRMWSHKVSFAFCWQAAAIHSNRRFIKQGRLMTLFQGMSEHHYVVRKFVRPIMKKAGVGPKWHD